MSELRAAATQTPPARHKQQQCLFMDLFSDAAAGLLDHVLVLSLNQRAESAVGTGRWVWCLVSLRPVGRDLVEPLQRPITTNTAVVSHQPPAASQIVSR